MGWEFLLRGMVLLLGGILAGGGVVLFVYDVRDEALLSIMGALCAIVLDDMIALFFLYKTTKDS